MQAKDNYIFNYELAKAYKKEIEEMWDEYLIEDAGI